MVNDLDEKLAAILLKDKLQLGNEPWPWNVGKGNEQQRMTALIYTAMDHPNPVTRYICRDMLAKIIVECRREVP